MIDDALLGMTHESLLARAQDVQKVKFGPRLDRTFELKDIRRGVANDGISGWLSDEVWPYPKSQPTLYVIRAGDAETTTRLMTELQNSEDRDFACAKVNDATGGSNVLYVGSSEGIRKRLREHLWRASTSTYAMHLHRWCKVTEGEVTVSIRPILHCTDRAVRQDLENTLWRTLSPRLGKFGGK